MEEPLDDAFPPVPEPEVDGTDEPEPVVVGSLVAVPTWELLGLAPEDEPSVPDGVVAHAQVVPLQGELVLVDPVAGTLLDGVVVVGCVSAVGVAEVVQARPD